MLMLLGIIGCALMITTLIYISAHPDKIQAYIDSIGWIQSVQNWISSLPEFVQIFLGVLLFLLFTAYLLIVGKKVADGEL